MVMDGKREYISEDGAMDLRDIKVEDNVLSHSGLAALAAAAADETAQLTANAMNNKHTNRKTGADMKIFLSYLISVNELRAPQNIPEAELDKHLCSFFMIVRKTDKSEYEPCSLRSMLASIERYLKINGYPSSLTKDMCFANTRYTLKVKQKILREMGKGAKTSQTLHITSLKDKSLDRTFEAKEMGPYSPGSIAQTLCFVFVVYLRLRKATEHKKLLWGDVILDRDQNGREYITFSDQMLQRCTLQYLKQCQPVVYSLPDTPERDPVRIYKLYASKRTPTMNYQYAPFYLGINIFNPTDNQSWYKSIAMGINKLNDMVRQVREVTGMTQNTCLNDTAESPQDLSLSSADKHSRSSTPETCGDMVIRNQLQSSIEKYKTDNTRPNTVTPGTTEHEHDNYHGEYTPNINESIHTKLQEMSNHEPFHIEPIIESSDDTSDVIDDDYEGGDDRNEYFNESVSSSDETEVDHRVGQKQVDLSATKAIYNDTVTCKESELSLSDAQRQFEFLLNRLAKEDVSKFESWYKNIDIVIDNQTGKRVGRAKDVSYSDISHHTDAEQQIVLNITLSNKAFHGEQPLTVTATSRFIDSQIPRQTSSDNMCLSQINIKSQSIKEKICGYSKKCGRVVSKIPSDEQYSENPKRHKLNDRR